ncbi:hypothetical protein ACROYT_G037646 [Oculina patagonica]
MAEIEPLELHAIIGFAGEVPGGLLVNCDREHLIYPLGNKIVVEEIKEDKKAASGTGSRGSATKVNSKSKSTPNDRKMRQRLLSGQGDKGLAVSCLAVSKSGKYLASGEKTHMGFKADVILWDFERGTIIHTLDPLHKVKVEALAFSPNDKYLVSLGGQDDGVIVVWDVKSGSAICGSVAGAPSAGYTFAVAYANLNDEMFVTGGDNTLRVWELDIDNRKIRPTEVAMGQLKRTVKCIQMSNDDKHFYCGTTTGDILEINMGNKLMTNYGPKDSERFSLGVLAIRILMTGDLLVGAGDGTVAIIKIVNGKFKKIQSVKVDGGITSIALRGQGHQFFVGTKNSHMYLFSYSTFEEYVRIKTCHCSPVNDVIFPYNSSDLILTCSKEEIRIWSTQTNQELVRITVPNMTCNAIAIMRCGTSIVSGWDDGKIRFFTPESGRLLYAIENAHKSGVTAVTTTDDTKNIISGGGEGEVRVWEKIGSTWKMKGSVKEHTAAVTCINVRCNRVQQLECVSASKDGTCIVWNLEAMGRNAIVFATTMFKAVCYNREESQIITAGTDRKIAYWETYDGSQIRELEGSTRGSIDGMDISTDGTHFVTGGADKEVVVWKYNEGQKTHVGIGHAGGIGRVKICPNQKWIVSIGTDGSILRWKYPH